MKRISDKEKYIIKYEQESWKNSTVSKIYPFLKGGLFHRTSIEGYRGIKKSGKILSNNGQFPYTYPQSRFYFASSKSYISLFDFSSVRYQDLISIHHTWGGFFFDQNPVTIVLRLDKEQLSDKLIPNSAAKTDNPERRGYIPYIETWYPEAIPFNAIIGLIISFEVGTTKPSFFQEFSSEDIDAFENTIDEIDRQCY